MHSPRSIMVSEKETNQYQCITHTSHQGKLLPPAPIAYQAIDRIGNDEGDRRIEENIDNSSYLIAFSTEATSHLQDIMPCKYKHRKSKEPTRHLVTTVGPANLKLRQNQYQAQHRHYNAASKLHKKQCIHLLNIYIFTYIPVDLAF